MAHENRVETLAKTLIEKGLAQNLDEARLLAQRFTEMDEQAESREQIAYAENIPLSGRGKGFANITRTTPSPQPHNQAPSTPAQPPAQEQATEPAREAPAKEASVDINEIFHVSNMKQT